MTKQKQPTPNQDIEGIVMTTDTQTDTPTTPTTPTTSTTPEQVEDDLLSKLRLPQTYSGAAVAVKKPLISVAVRKPGKMEFFRVHPEHFLECLIIEDKTSRENYLLLPEVAQHVPDLAVPVRLYYCLSRQDAVFLWPVKLPRDDRRGSDWSKSAAECASIGQQSWLRIVADMDAGAYQPYVALADLGEPEWPQVSWSEVLKHATRSRVIDTADHTVIRRLMGRE